MMLGCPCLQISEVIAAVRPNIEKQSQFIFRNQEVSASLR